MSKASLELGGGNWGTKDGNLLAYAQGNESSNLVPREFTFTRGSDIAATRINSSGLIEKYRENLLEQSNQFDTTWVTYDATPTSGENGYDGSSDAWKLSSNSAGTNRRISQAKSINGIVTFSVYAKAGTYNGRLYLRVGGDQNYRAFFDLSNGTTDGGTNLITSESVSVGNGWYRYIAVWNIGTGSTPEIRFGDATITDDYFYIQDAQLEQGLVATSYLESGATTATSGVADNEPRIDYTGGTASLLLEPQRTNLITNSEYLVSINGGSVEYNSSISPEGLQNATKVIFGANVNDSATMNLSASCSGNTQYTWSAYVKNISGTGLFNVRIDTDTTTILVNQDITATSEWTRVSHTFTTDASATSFGSNSRYRSSADGNEILIWGAQLEEGSYPTSYIPTYGTSVTRNGDSCLINPMDITYSTNYTFFGEFERIVSEDEESILMQLYDGNDSSNNQYRILNRTNAELRTRIYYNGNNTSIISATNSFQLGQTIKWAVQYNSGAIKVFIDGQEIGNTTQTVGGIDVISLERMKVKQILLFSSTLSDREAVNLTSPYSTYQELVTAEGLTWESPTCTTNSITELQSI